MKKCPNCQKTFEDNMKFCQSDGTPLVVVADTKPEADPYATMVANKSDLGIPPKEEPSPEPKEEPEVEADPYATMVAPSQAVKKDEASDDDDLLSVLGDDNKEEEIDPMKTMVVSGNTSDNIKANIPDEKPKNETPGKPIASRINDAPNEVSNIDASEAQTILSPDIPKFNEPKIDPPDLDDSAPKQKANEPSSKPEAKKETPASPFDSKPKEDKPAPIPSPFDDSMPPGYAPPSTPPFEPPIEPLKPEPLNEPKKGDAPKSPFAEPNDPVVKADTDDWNPASASVAAANDQQGFNQPSAPVAAANDQNQGFNQPFDNSVQANTPSADGQSQTLAIASLVFAVLSVPCCTWVIFSLAAMGTGFYAKNLADKNPEEYGGRTLALAGIGIGAATLVIGIIVSVLYLLGFFGNLLGL